MSVIKILDHPVFHVPMWKQFHEALTTNKIHKSRQFPIHWWEQQRCRLEQSRKT